MTDWIRELHDKAAQRVRDVVARPLGGNIEDVPQTDEEFDPWDLFSSLYGSYSSDFDEMAIDVLEGLASGEWSDRRDLASEMFREMLCKAELCEYGTSPRACFPTQQFKAVLPELIAKWKAYSEIQWSRTDGG